MTLSASVMIIMIEILRVLTMRQPKNLFRIFWAAAAVRLIVPFSFPFRFSAGTGFLYLVSCLAGTGSVLPFQGAAAEAFGGSAGKGGGTAAFFDIGDSGITGMFSSARFSDLPGGKIFLCIYLIGAAAAALWFSVNYVRSIRLFRESLPVSSICARRLAEKMKIRRGIDVRESEFIRSPLTYGIMHPVILLPKGISDIAEKDQMEYIFTHELVHVRRFDAVLKLILTAALCLHWFNPFVWIMYFLAARDIELACDESVIRILGKAVADRIRLYAGEICRVRK